MNKLLTSKALAASTTAHRALRTRACDTRRTAVGLYAIAASGTFGKSKRGIGRRGFRDWVCQYNGSQEEEHEAKSDRKSELTHGGYAMSK